VVVVGMRGGNQGEPIGPRPETGRDEEEPEEKKSAGRRSHGGILG
jgi:hypothetical protein